MRSDVYLEATRPGVGLRAVGALVRQFTGVNKLVGLEVAPRDKLFSAIWLVADKRPLSRLK